MISARKSSLKLINDAQKVWSILNGVVCIYKPSGLTLNQTRKTLMANICRGKHENKIESNEIPTNIHYKLQI